MVRQGTHKYTQRKKATATNWVLRWEVTEHDGLVMLHFDRERLEENHGGTARRASV